MSTSGYTRINSPIDEWIWKERYYHPSENSLWTGPYYFGKNKGDVLMDGVDRRDNNFEPYYINNKTGEKYSPTLGASDKFQSLFDRLNTTESKGEILQYGGNLQQTTDSYATNASKMQKAQVHRMDVGQPAITNNNTNSTINSTEEDAAEKAEKARQAKTANAKELGSKLGSLFGKGLQNFMSDEAKERRSAIRNARAVSKFERWQQNTNKGMEYAYQNTMEKTSNLAKNFTDKNNNDYGVSAALITNTISKNAPNSISIAKERAGGHLTKFIKKHTMGKTLNLSSNLSLISKRQNGGAFYGNMLPEATAVAAVPKVASSAGYQDLVNIGKNATSNAIPAATPANNVAGSGELSKISRSAFPTLSDYNVGSNGKLINSKTGEPLVLQVGNKKFNTWQDLHKAAKYLGYDIGTPLVTAGTYAKGGNLFSNTMNTRKFQEGGDMAAAQSASPEQMQQQIVALVQAAAQGDEKAQQTIQQIMQAAQQGDQQAMQIAQMIQQVMQEMQGQAQAAKYGAKLNYIHKLRTGVNRDEEIVYQKCGGRMSKRIVKKKAIGGEAPRAYETGSTKTYSKTYFGKDGEKLPEGRRVMYSKEGDYLTATTGTAGDIHRRESQGAVRGADVGGSEHQSIEPWYYKEIEEKHRLKEALAAERRKNAFLESTFVPNEPIESLPVNYSPTSIPGLPGGSTPIELIPIPSQIEPGSILDTVNSKEDWLAIKNAEKNKKKAEKWQKKAAKWQSKH